MDAFKFRVNFLIAPLCLPLLVSSSVYSDSRTQQVDALFSPWDRPDSPGCALGIIENGHFIYQRGYGMANLEYDITISSATVFRIGSVSKQFSALGILLAAAEGRLSLDDDIRKHLPELPEYDRPITIRHLIHHTSGIRDYLLLMRLADKRDEDHYTDEEVMKILARQKQLNFTPGDEYLYSNSGYFLLSKIILRATGKTLREWAEDKIFKPLGMQSTHFHDDFRMIVKNRASGYRPKQGGGFEIDMTTLNMVGDGGVFTTAEDFLKWDRNFDSNQLGGENIMKQMLTPGVLNGGKKQTYAYGLHVSQYRGLTTVAHGGSFVGFRAGVLRFPEHKFSIFCLCNLSDIDPLELARPIADIYLADRFPPEKTVKVTIAKKALQEKTGTYWNPRTGTFLELVLKQGQLELVFGKQSFRLAALDEKRFLAARGLDRFEVQFDKQSADSPMRILVQFEGQRPFTYHRVKPAPLTRKELRQYEGCYHCDELDVSYRVRARKEGKLVFKMTHFPDQPLQPMFRDGFRWELGSVVFGRDSRGNVSGFRLTAMRARNFEFVREQSP